MIFFRKDTLVRRSLSVFLMFTSAAVPFHLMAAEAKLGEIGRSAQSFGNMLLQGTELATENSGNLYFQGSSDPISINDLYPSTSGSSSLGADRYFPEEPDVEGAKGYFDSDTEMSKAGSASQKVLWQDANSETPTLYGAAYKILLDQKASSKPDFHNDPLMNQTKDVYDNIDVIAQGFGDCTTEDTFSLAQREIHMPVYKHCERAIEYSGDYNIKQDYSIDLIQYVGGQPNYKSCGSGCLEVWVGTKGDNYWSGSCKIFEEYTRFRVTNKDAIISATIVEATFDDYFQIWFNGNEIWSHTPGVFPPETPGACERATSWNVQPNIDVTSALKSEDEIIAFKTRTSVTGGGEGYARIVINYDPKKVFKTTNWYPQKETVVIDQIKDGFCTDYTFTCNDPGIGLDDKGCINENGVKICPDDVGSIHPEINPFCRDLDIKAQCEFYKGQMDCWTDVHGEVHCPVNDAENFVPDKNNTNELSNCAVLESDSQCGFIKSECVEGSVGAETGTCYVYNETYDCGYSVPVSDIDKETTYQCSGEIQCMGSDCLDINSSTNGDFTKAASLLHAAQNMAGDMICDEGTNNGGGEVSPSGCTIFKGTSSECKKALGGTVDCCEAPDGVNFADYLSMITSLPKIDAAIMNVESTSSMVNSIQSGYAYLREPIASTYNQVTGPFTSYIDNITGMVDGVKQVATDLLNKLGQKAQEVMIEALRDIGFDGVIKGGSGVTGGTVMSPEMGAEFVGPPAPSGGLGATMGSVISFIGWVYLIYQVAMLIIQIIYKCTKEELTLGVDKELKKCTFVGSYCKKKILGSCIEKREAYCCFPSPLGRIIQEQGRAQLGKNMGTGKAPRCEGLTIEEIGLLDWDKMDLDEWVGMLQEHDLFHNVETVDIDKLTGKGVTLDIEGGNRLNSAERAIERAKDAQVDSARQINANRYEAPTGATSVK